MNLQKGVLLISVLLTAVLVVHAMHSVKQVALPVQGHVTGFVSVPVKGMNSFSVSGFSQGFSEIFVVGETGPVVLYSSAKTPVVDVNCDTSCVNQLEPKELVVSGDVFIESFIAEKESSVLPWSTCPGCRTIAAYSAPNHLAILAAISLLLIILAAHAMKYKCRKTVCKRSLAGVFIGSFSLLIAVFVLTFALPSFAVLAQYSATVFAAGGVIALFIIGAVEMTPKNPQVLKTQQSKSSVWKELEQAEKKWRRKK